MRKRFWLLVLLPGGGLAALALWIYSRGKAQQAQAAAAAKVKADNIANNADPLAAAQQFAKAATTRAGAIAQSLRDAGLAGDTLAQAILGIPKDALTAPALSSDQVAANNTKIKSLQDEIQSLTSQLADYQAGYARDHNGGQSPDQEAAIENGIGSRIAALQQQIAQLQAGTATA